jgi:hypothetical protein
VCAKVGIGVSDVGSGTELDCITEVRRSTAPRISWGDGSYEMSFELVVRSSTILVLRDE